MPSTLAASATRVVVAGGGVGAVEAVLALRAVAGARVDLELIAPDTELVLRPVAVAEPFGGAPPLRLPLARLEATHGIRRRATGVEAVDPQRRRLHLRGGEEAPYDVLVLATGARRQQWLPGALTFPDVPAYRQLLGALEDGSVSHVLFAVPPGTSWTLPLYELCLLTTAWLADHGVVGARLTLATPDPEPLAAFGPAASRAVRGLLSGGGGGVGGGRGAGPDAAGTVDLGRLGRLRPDRIVTLPRLTGRPIAGLPTDAEDFVPVDEHAAVRGLADVYAVGDATAFPVKHGALATQQADAAADAIAERLGLPVRAEPFTPVLRGILLGGVTSAYLRGGGAEPPTVGYATGWSAPMKVAARHLSAYLATRDDAPAEDPETARQAVEFADADAQWGDLRSALALLAVAERVGGEPTGTFAEQRERWERELAARDAHEPTGAPAPAADRGR